MDDTGAQLLFRLWPLPTNDAPSPSPATGLSKTGARLLPNETTAVSLLDRLLHHAIVVVTDGGSFRMREARKRHPGNEWRPGGGR